MHIKVINILAVNGVLMHRHDTYTISIIFKNANNLI